MGVDSQDCTEFQPKGLFTGGCGPKPFYKIGTRINDTFALLALAAAVGIHLIKKEKD